MFAEITERTLLQSNSLAGISVVLVGDDDNGDDDEVLRINKSLEMHRVLSLMRPTTHVRCEPFSCRRYFSREIQRRATPSPAWYFRVNGDAT